MCWAMPEIETLVTNKMVYVRLSVVKTDGRGSKGSNS